MPAEFLGYLYIVPAGVELPFKLELPPFITVVLGRGTSLFALFLRLRRKFGTSSFLSSYFNYTSHSSVTDWPTTAWTWLIQWSLFYWSVTDSLSATNILLFLFFPFSLAPVISFPFFSKFSISCWIMLHSQLYSSSPHLWTFRIFASYCIKVSRDWKGQLLFLDLNYNTVRELLNDLDRHKWFLIVSFRLTTCTHTWIPTSTSSLKLIKSITFHLKIFSLSIILALIQKK